LRVEVWGARGSIPSSQPGTLKYGGNTACLEIRTRMNDHIIIDAGSGIRRLGVKMVRGHQEPVELEGMVDFIVEEVFRTYAREKPDPLRALEGSLDYKNEIHLLMTHNHWDHIQGFPFFIPGYIPTKTINIYGQLKTDHRLYDVFSGQMQKSYFPVKLEQMGAKKEFTEIVEDTFRIGDAVVTSRSLNHPQGCLGYRITSGEMTIAVCTDTEHFEGRLDENVIALAHDADIFFYDCQYTPDEYTAKKGWGHSTWQEGVKIAKEAGVKKIVMFHHDPEHDDDFIRKIEMQAKEVFPNLMAAYEGLVLADFPDRATVAPVIHEPGCDGEAPEITMNKETVTVACGTTLMSLREGYAWGLLDRFVHQGAKYARFDCQKVTFTEGAGLVALADTITDLNDRNIETEIFNASTELLRKLEIARFSFITKFNK
jgi:phosphoribosyl 1,2-cyclic phosphodiesterase